MDYLSKLPTDVTNEILSHLDNKDLIVVSTLSKFFKIAAFDEKIWKGRKIMVMPIKPNISNHPLYQIAVGMGLTFDLQKLTGLDLRLVKFLENYSEFSCLENIPNLATEICANCEDIDCITACESCDDEHCMQDLILSGGRLNCKKCSDNAVCDVCVMLFSRQKIKTCTGCLSSICNECRLLHGATCYPRVNQGMGAFHT